VQQTDAGEDHSRRRAQDVGGLQPSHPPAEAGEIGLDRLLQVREAHSHHQRWGAEQEEGQTTVEHHELVSQLAGERGHVTHAEHVAEGRAHSLREVEGVGLGEVGAQRSEAALPQGEGQERQRQAGV
jgi:hypothetical protein